MEIGLVGLGKMGGNMRTGSATPAITVVGYDTNPDMSDSTSMQDMVSKLTGSPHRLGHAAGAVIDPVSSRSA